MCIFDSVCFVKSDADINPNRYRVFFQPQFSHNIHYRDMKRCEAQLHAVDFYSEITKNRFCSILIRELGIS